MTREAPPNATSILVNGQWVDDPVKVEAARKAAVPQAVSRAQGKAALIQAGLWQHVLDYVASIPDVAQKALTEVALLDTQEWRRDSEMVKQFGESLGLDDAALDDLFIAASKVTF